MSQVNSIKSNSNQKPIKPLFNEVDWSDGFPLSKEYDDIFCQKDVIKETNHVFLGPNNLVKRWKANKKYEFNIRLYITSRYRIFVVPKPSLALYKA